MESTSSIIKSSLLSLIMIIVLNQMHGYKACLETERTALLELKSFLISGHDSEFEDSILTSWVDDDGISSDCCDWERVKCNAATRRVTELLLNWTRDGSSLLNMSLFHPFEELQSLDFVF